MVPTRSRTVWLLLLVLLQLFQVPWLATSLIQPVGAIGRFQKDPTTKDLLLSNKRIPSHLLQSSPRNTDTDIKSTANNVMESSKVDEGTAAVLEGSPFETTKLGLRSGLRGALASMPQVEYLIFAVPILTALVAFATYHPLLKAFSGFCDCLSQNVAFMDDGGSGVLFGPGVRSVLGGPVVTCIAILFGTLVAGTITTLVGRNNNLLKAGINMAEEIRTARLHLETFSPKYQTQINQYLDDFHKNWLLDFGNEHTTLVTIRRLTPFLDDCTRAIHTARNDKGETLAAISDASSSIQGIRDCQRDAMVEINRGFPWVHYANLAVLGVSICIIFLIDTSLDKNNLASAQPQLALAWSLLLGTLSMLTLVVADAASLFSSITRSIREIKDVNLDEMNRYTQGVNLGSNSQKPSSDCTTPFLRDATGNDS
mmetsp:Transcript_10434/g.28847  ORF Transcript_10434/g.28847 Transcript_10434/m.28847 type:complete len:426 (+) Transcript_10434:71-1348(+)|eukprot:CAMPEP_0168736608 /NCGR_PEP_ID=MMETSP0724-20121128/9949_1 /TAXON_ID=265536 /ORGANISM="Amphiprora sp., Strain CCMP467" /LENGTH=425 /DNA_ID=CAMNT_0008783813 /DNA_START=9 /DNA_END=1286 /DNA_ORIENTATION=-